MDYKRYHKEVLDMQRRVRDWTDDRSHAHARQLEDAIQRLEDDVQVQKSVHTIRDQLKRIDSMMDRFDEQAMSHQHIDQVQDWARDGLRKYR